jgi:hypothetical protein
MSQHWLSFVPRLKRAWGSETIIADDSRDVEDIIGEAIARLKTSDVALTSAGSVDHNGRRWGPTPATAALRQSIHLELAARLKYLEPVLAGESEFVCDLCRKTISAKCSYATCENLDAGTREFVLTLDRVAADLARWTKELVANATVAPAAPAALRDLSERSFRDSVMRMAGKPDEHGLTPEQYLVRVDAPYESAGEMRVTGGWADPSPEVLALATRDPYAWFDTRELDKR